MHSIGERDDYNQRDRNVEPAIELDADADGDRIRLAVSLIDAFAERDSLRNHEPDDEPHANSVTQLD